MIVKDKYFPYPVIKEHKEDFINSDFKIQVGHKDDDEYIILDIKFDLTNESIKKLINEDKAKFVLHLEEPTTLFREIYSFSNSQNEVVIPKDKIRMVVELSAFIVAVEDIFEFKSDDLDIIYEDIPISFKKYNIIGISQSKKIEVDKESDEIKEVSSIFSVIPHEDADAIYKIKLGNERIIIEIPKEEYPIYNELSYRYRLINDPNNYILMSLIIMPSFVEVLTILKEGTDNYRNNQWYNPLIKAYDKKGINLEKEFESGDFSAYELTQIIFDKVLNNGLERLKEVK